MKKLAVLQANVGTVKTTASLTETVFSFGLSVASTSKPILKQNNQCSLKQNNKSEQLCNLLFFKNSTLEFLKIINKYFLWPVQCF